MSNLAELRTNTRRFIDETDSSNSSYSEGELNDYLSRAARKVATLLEWTITTQIATTQEDEALYVLPDPLLYIMQVHLDGKPLEVCDRGDLDGVSANWQNAENSTPKKAYREDNKVIGLWPPPDAGSDNKVLEVHGIKLTANMTDDLEEPDLHIILQDLLPIRAAVYAQQRAGNYQAAAYLEKFFVTELQDAKSKVGKFAEELLSMRWY